MELVIKEVGRKIHTNEFTRQNVKVAGSTSGEISHETFLRKMKNIERKITDEDRDLLRQRQIFNPNFLVTRDVELLYAETQNPDQAM